MLVGVDVGVFIYNMFVRKIKSFKNLKTEVFKLLLTEVGIDVGVLVGMLVGVDVGVWPHKKSGKTANELSHLKHAKNIQSSRWLEHLNYTHRSRRFGWRASRR